MKIFDLMDLILENSRIFKENSQRHLEPINIMSTKLLIKMKDFKLIDHLLVSLKVQK